MNYPLISEYIEAIKSPEDNFDKLHHLHPVLDEDGQPIMSSGNFAVVFKMTDGEKDYAVKCFIKEQVGRFDAYQKICHHLNTIKSDYLVHVEFYEDELFVDTQQTDETEFPVLLMDWVEGDTLDKYINKFKGNSFELYELTYNFRKLSQWLVSQDFAHGDIKPDNIVVGSDGNIVLIDYDGMYVPKMNGESFREFGSPNFRHPFLKGNYDKHIDDFALSSICLALKMISISFGIMDRYNLKDGLLFSVEDYTNLNNSAILGEIVSLLVSEKILGLYYATFIKAYSGNPLISDDFDFKEEKDIESLLVFWPEGVYISDERMIKSGIQTSDGIVYSKDERMVIGFVNKNYNAEDIYIKEGTIAICENAFKYHIGEKVRLKLPSTMRYFNSLSLNYEYSTISWDSPWFTYSNGYIFTKDKTECILKHLKDATFDENTSILGAYLYSNLTFDGIWPKQIVKIRHRTFSHAGVPVKLIIPNGISCIGKGAFSGCSVEEVYIPNTLKKLSGWSFHLCKNLVSINFDDNCKIRNIEDNTFCNCTKLETIHFPKSLESIGESAFQWCENIELLLFPKNLKIIGKEAFNMNKEFGEKQSSKLRQLIFPNSLTEIGKNCFSNCEELESIQFKGVDIIIEKEAFTGCVNLQKCVYNSINRIGNRAFTGCTKLQLEIRDDIKFIEEGGITGVTIDNKSTIYYIENDSLISKEDKLLLYYWGTDKIFNVAEGIRNLNSDSFLNIPQAIILPQSYDESNLKSACFCNILIVPKHIKVEESIVHHSNGNTMLYTEKVFIDELGVIYSEDKQELIKYPINISNTEYKVLDGCKIIKRDAFEHDFDSDGQSVWPLGNNLIKLLLPEGLLAIEDNGLLGCIELSELHIPNSVERIGVDALPKENLKFINIPSSLKEMSMSSISESVRYISGGSLSYIVEEEYYESSDDWYFLEHYIRSKDGNLLWVSPETDFLIIDDNIRNLIKGSIPKTVESIKFENPDVIIEEGAIPFSVTRISGVLNNYIIYSDCLVSKDGVLLWVKPEVEQFSISGGITRIGDFAFYRRQYLKTILIPEQIKSIGISAFNHCREIKEMYIIADLEEVATEALKSSERWVGSKYCYMTLDYPEKIYTKRAYKKKLLELLSPISSNKICIIDEDIIF